MREAPQWFQDELERIGGTNPYGEPVFRLAWSQNETTVIGGRFSDGFEGYRRVPAIPGVACWALMMWEPRELQGSAAMWEYDYRDPETGYLQCGGFPHFGRYRLLKRFIHRELINGELVTYRMEPCGFMLDIMVPMLKIWLKMTDDAKVKALQQEEQIEKDEYMRKVKDARDGCKINRGSQLVAKRAEMIERGFAQAMAMAAQTGLGMRMD